MDPRQGCSKEGGDGCAALWYDMAALRPKHECGARCWVSSRVEWCDGIFFFFCMGRGMEVVRCVSNPSIVQQRLTPLPLYQRSQLHDAILSSNGF